MDGHREVGMKGDLCKPISEHPPWERQWTARVRQSQTVHVSQPLPSDYCRSSQMSALMVGMEAMLKVSSMAFFYWGWYDYAAAEGSTFLQQSWILSPCCSTIIWGEQLDILWCADYIGSLLPLKDSDLSWVGSMNIWVWFFFPCALCLNQHWYPKIYRPLWFNGKGIFQYPGWRVP